MNLYCHFPFCRVKCPYCALTSRAGSTPSVRATYVTRLMHDLPPAPTPFNTIYFGGGSPALCDLRPLLNALQTHGFCTPTTEFTIELHPHDVTPALLDELRAGGVNRISLGLQALDDATLAVMKRPYTVQEAFTAFALIQTRFANAGIDLIVGYPFAPGQTQRDFTPLLNLHPQHVSVYTLIRENGTRLDKQVKRGELILPDDDAALAEYAAVAKLLKDKGLHRYEVANWSLPGFECQHNLAVWRGEDYLGLGEGAHGRQGLCRTIGTATGYATETLTPAQDALERALFSLRTSLGFSPQKLRTRFPILASHEQQWQEELSFAVRHGHLTEKDGTYFLTSRGYEVCDALLERLI